MENFKLILLIMYFSTGIALIGIAFFKKITANKGEVIEKFKEYKMVSVITNILFGLMILILGYLYTKQMAHGLILILSLPIVEITQRFINNHYIKDSDEVTTIEEESQLAKDINIDEILDDNFFDEKISEPKIEKTIEEKNETNDIINELMQEGITNGIFSEEVFDIFNPKENEQKNPI